ncbi:protein of unknown function DUF58 [Cyanobacterium stanieri PCC 7202]|uniref:DUF58 domain-containing protein n=1 Tax=Cyanobacterium stanieri (strain ATCC 29140 / PCC 7202) TaxID=292563 RepID=K9YIE4_CYASC|nr:protein of unknown function DUF58 [Cyanobacterium stanieri PCC 7202]
MNRKLTSNHGFFSSLTQWWRNRLPIPSYGGWVLLGIALSFFGAATNTMAGWLYVLSGTSLALAGLNIVIASQTVKKLTIKRLPIEPISAGDELLLELAVTNPSKSSKNFIEIVDPLPFVSSKAVHSSIESLYPQETKKITYYAQVDRRGIYHWSGLDIKSAAPIGLFYARKRRNLEARAIVYPQIIPLKSSPLIDNLGREQTQQQQSERLYHNATEGVTKALRQYRFGDPPRLIHWRSSARFGELQVRELETITGGEQIIICLDNNQSWEQELFERAVIAAASLYFYCSRQQLDVKLWTAKTNTIKGNHVVLEALAAIQPRQGDQDLEIPSEPLVWLSNNPHTLKSLPQGSRWMLFLGENNDLSREQNVSSSGLIYQSSNSLENILQKPLKL